MIDKKDSEIAKLQCANEELNHAVNVYSNLFDKLRCEILGADWYAVDPLGGLQCAEFMTDEIIKKYNRMEIENRSLYLKFKYWVKGVIERW